MHTLTLDRAPSQVARTVGIALAAGFVVALVRTSPVGVALASSLAVATVAAIVDVRTHRLPDTLVVAAALPVVAVGAASGALDDVLLGAVVFAAPILAVHLVSPVVMGFGDVKFAAALGGATGLLDPLWALVALCVASGVTAIVGLFRRARSLPFGPGLVAGAASAVTIAAAFPNALSEGRLPWR